MIEDERTVAAALASLLLALMLEIVPLPDAVQPWRPDWLALVLVYWALAGGTPFGLAAAWLLGLALDTLTGALLGQHALALCLAVYPALRFRLRLRVFPMAQVSLVVLGLLTLYQLTLLWIDGLAGRTVPFLDRVAPIVAGTLAWPALGLLLDGARRQRRTQRESL